MEKGQVTLPLETPCEQIAQRFLEEVGGVYLEPRLELVSTRETLRGRAEASGGDVEVKVFGDRVGLAKVLPNFISVCQEPTTGIWERAECKGPQCPSKEATFAPECPGETLVMGTGKVLGRTDLESTRSLLDLANLPIPEEEEQALALWPAERLGRILTARRMEEMGYFYCELDAQEVPTEEREIVEMTGGIRVEFPKGTFGLVDRPVHTTITCIVPYNKSKRWEELAELDKLITENENARGELVRLRRGKSQGGELRRIEEKEKELKRTLLRNQKTIRDYLLALTQGEDPPLQVCRRDITATVTKEDIIHAVRGKVPGPSP